MAIAQQPDKTTGKQPWQCKTGFYRVKQKQELHHTNLGATSEQRSIINSSKCRWDNTNCSSSDSWLSSELTAEQYKKNEKSQGKMTSVTTVYVVSVLKN